MRGDTVNADMTGSVKLAHGPARRYHVHGGRRAHHGDFSQVDTYLGYPLRTVCGQWVAATYTGEAPIPRDCARCLVGAS